MHTGQVHHDQVHDEPPGCSLNEARLLLVTLDYIVPEGWGTIKRTRTPGFMLLFQNSEMC